MMYAASGRSAGTDPALAGGRHQFGVAASIFGLIMELQLLFSIFHQASLARKSYTDTRKKGAMRFCLILMAASSLFAADPNRILFTRLQPGQTGLFISDTDGTGERPLLPATGLDYNPSWSPDGKWIVFTSERDGSAELYRAKPDGTGIERLTDNPAYDDQASFSPESNQIVFVTTRSGGTADLWTLNLRTLKAKALTSGPGGDFRPVWSPDGKWIAFSSDRGSTLPPARGRWEHLQIADVYLIRPDGSGLKRITEHGNFCGSPKWSSDSKRVIAYCMPAEETLNARTTEDGETQLVSIDTVTGAATGVAAGPGEKFAPTLLPSGKVGYIRKNGPAPGIFYGNGEPGPKGAIRSASWSPDGRQVVFHKAVSAPPNTWRTHWSRNAQYELVTSSMMPSFHPSGDRFVAGAPANGTYAGAMIVVESGTGASRTLFSREGISALGPQWSPQGDAIFFGLGAFRLFTNLFRNQTFTTEDRVDGGAHVAMMKPDGTGFKQLTTGANSNGYPSPAPDGKRIVYRTFGPAGNGLRILNLEDNTTTTLTTEYDNFPFWSPRGDLIMFSRADKGDYEIFTIRPDGRDLKRLTFAKGNDAHMTWSPDGEWIVFASTRMGFKDEAIYTDAPQPYGELFVMRYNGKDVTQLTDNQWEDGAPTWQPQPKLRSSR
jgi:Tol biopolymer transport system component